MAASPLVEDTAVHRRINITLSEDTLTRLEHLVPKGDRSRVIDQAVRTYLDAHSRSVLRKRLQEGAQRRATRDLQLAEEWFPLEEEVWNADRD
jgi:CopG family transcriptional regulator/antitoxin EndoAI